MFDGPLAPDELRDSIKALHDVLQAHVKGDPALEYLCAQLIVRLRR